MEKVLLLLLIFSLLSCSSNDEEEKDEIDNIFANTSWTYKTVEIEHEQKEYKNHENKHQLDNILKICPSLKYTISKKKVTEKTDTTDLCKKAGHVNHINASINFHIDNCTLSEFDFRHIQIVKSKIEETDYKFEGGTYLGTLYGTSHVGITVKEYGIYQASTSGDIMVLALDGNYTYNLVIREYTSIEKKQGLFNENTLLSFHRDNNSVNFFNDTISWIGILNQSNTELTLNKNGNSYIFTKK